MFTGIIQSVGKITDRQQIQGDFRFQIKTGLANSESIQLGDSIAMDGVCLTVTDRTADSVYVDVSLETASKTNVDKWQIGSQINIEPALALSTPLGGHLVTGHVDGLADCVSRQSEARSEAFVFSLPPGFERFVVDKGSITLNGVSLTVNQVTDRNIHINLIPHTLEHTNLDEIQSGDKVNFEIDTIARYVDKMLQPYKISGE